MVAMHEVEALSGRIAREFDPERIILFGSHAYGTPAEYSDVDILVIMPFEGHPFDKSMEILDRLDPDFSADVVVRSPGDAGRRYAECGPLIREASDSGKVLYERNGGDEAPLLTKEGVGGGRFRGRAELTLRRKNPPVSPLGKGGGEQ